MEENNQLMHDHPFSGHRHESCFKKYKNYLLLGIGIILVLGVVVGLIVGLSLRGRPSADGLANAVLVSNIMGHLNEFYKIAMTPGNNGSRGVLEGYNMSFSYVQSKLQSTGCVLSTQSFLAPVYYERATPAFSYSINGAAVALQPYVEFLQLRYGGNGVNNIAGRPVKTVLNGGCNAADWAAITNNDVALVIYQPTVNGTADCTAFAKVSAGAYTNPAAVIIANDRTRTVIANSRIRGDGYKPGDLLVNFPVLGVGYQTGQILSSSAGTILATISTVSEIIIANTQNLYCTTPGGNADNLIVVGAHLDGVPAGPGINDNGSGSAMLLEIVLQFFKLKFQPQNSKIQFSWWGAEELGLLGSRAFVNSSQTINQPVPFKSIKMGVNFDMMGSPNGIPEVHNIDANGTIAFNASVYNGSRAITAALYNYFDTNNIPALGSVMSGGSDYYPFALAGIPAGGLATGAGSLKSPAERTKYGGLANAALDPCYHQACDTVENINQQLLGYMAQSASRAIANWALNSDINAYLAGGQTVNFK